ncbi:MULTISPECIES: DUF2225 domain-containing protein [unclassified Fusibacter]|uniref:DUF2225 domain-containing protein n=1 Tax=unclassified Fusibacter TaxID=2624464 RepID=UPI0010117049|nr:MULTISPECIES: DUF2225 domain-containing protein [unclassified Fusibacter]MCK8058508.1 DUF2225 domain-containing protein [Fusibacter sp. A2]NPE22723.1 DUF2225 domain-containing protein [Fusibacter sp. A1]RXV60283.1 DUF2225 domain-containing protein [Fusibacter sp. A1]
MYDFIREETTVRKILKKRKFIEQGQEMGCCYFILSGSAHIYLNNGNEDVFVRKAIKDEILGLMEYLGNQNYPYTVIADEETFIAEINEENINSFISTMPQIANNLLNFFATSIEESNDYLCKSIESESTYTKDESFEVSLDDKILTLINNRKYKMILPQKHELNLYSKDVNCPVCQNKFKANHIKYSRLKVERRTDDFRVIYKDFDDLWYLIWICPYCNYANFHNDFYKLSAKSQKYLHDNLPRYSDGELKTSIKKTINDVIEDYIHLSRIMCDLHETILVKVRLLQSLVWLMGDAGDLQTQLKLKEHLLVALKDFHYNSPIKLNVDEEVKLAIKIAVIISELGEYKEAKDVLLKALQLRGMKKVYRTQIQNVLEKING